jgi:hypothetical protein
MTVRRATHNNSLDGIKEKLNHLSDIFSQKLNPAFTSIVLGSIDRAKDNRSISDVQILYLERLLDELQSTDLEPTVTYADRIEEVLWHANFNSRSVFLYFIKQISGKIQVEDTVIGKIELLAFERKKVNQMVCDRNVEFTDKYPCLQDVLNNWISEEMIFLKTKQELKIKSAQPEKAFSNDFKIALDLSVAQFSCLVRGLMEKKLILNTNLSELATFLSSVVVTKRSENISEGSFRRKYYNIEDSTKKSVIEILNKTIDWLMKS